MRNTIKKQSLLVFKQPPFYHKWYFMTEPFRMTCHLKRKQFPWKYRQWKRVLLLVWWSKPAVVLIVKRKAKSPCWYPRHQIRYISKFFFIFKGFSKLDPISTIRQSLFPIWTYTFSLRVKVMKVTEHAVCKIWFHLRRFWLRPRSFKKPESIRPKLIQISRKILKQYCTTHCTKLKHLNRSKELTIKPF